MKKQRIFCLILSVITVLAMALPVAAEPVQGSSAGCHGLYAQLPLAGAESLLPSSDGVVLFELNSSTMVYAYKADDRINPSSMVKIMTALVALEQGNLNDTVTVKRSTLDSLPIGIVSAGLQRGETITVLDLLYCCLVGSANDATAVLAEHIAGSQAAFVEKMNARARELGCKDTLFSNVNGLNDNIQYSTARDLAIITAAALENETFADAFSAQSYTVPATNLSEERTIHTTNYMLSDQTVRNYYDERVTGGKTAAATQTKRSLICTAQLGTARYLCVVMNADSVMSEDKISVEKFGSFYETGLLLDFAQQGYELRKLLDHGQSYSQHTVSDGENDLIAAPGADVYAVLPLEYDPALLIFSAEYDMSALTAPVKSGAVVGQLRVTFQGLELTSCDLTAMFAVARKGSTIRPADRITPDEEQGAGSKLLRWILTGLAVAAGLVLLSLLIARLVKNARIRAMHRRRKRNRRRSR